jgi:hypothetical protein
MIMRCSLTRQANLEQLQERVPIVSHVCGFVERLNYTVVVVPYEQLALLDAPLLDLADCWVKLKAVPAVPDEFPCGRWSNLCNTWRKS